MPILRAMATDNFTRANEAPLAGNWTKITGMASPPQMNLTSNQVVMSALNIDDSGYRYTALTPPNDQYSSASITSTGTAAGAGYGVVCRVSTGAKSFYRLVVDGATPANYELGKEVAGAFTLLASGTVSRSAGDTLLIGVQGSLLFAMNAGTQFASVTDTALTSGQWGIFYSSEVTGGNIDNWEGGSVVNPSAGLMVNQAVKRSAYYRAWPIGPTPDRRLADKEVQQYSEHDMRMVLNNRSDHGKRYEGVGRSARRTTLGVLALP